MDVRDRNRAPCSLPERQPGCSNHRPLSDTASVDPHWTPAYLIIRPDGKYTFAKNTDGKSGESGTLWFEDQVFLIKDDFCSTPGQYSAELFQKDDQPSTLVFTLIEDGCAAREKILTSQPAAWYGPLEVP